jgi:hypothetical protein
VKKKDTVIVQVIAWHCSVDTVQDYMAQGGSIFSHKGSLNCCEEMSIELTKTNRYLQLFVKM